MRGALFCVLQCILCSRSVCRCNDFLIVNSSRLCNGALQTNSIKSGEVEDIKNQVRKLDVMCNVKQLIDTQCDCAFFYWCVARHVFKVCVCPSNCMEYLLKVAGDGAAVLPRHPQESSGGTAHAGTLYFRQRKNLESVFFNLSWRCLRLLFLLTFRRAVVHVRRIPRYCAAILRHPARRSSDLLGRVQEGD